MKRLLAMLIAFAASALVMWRFLQRVQELQGELARSQRDLASQRARAMEAERQLAMLNEPAAAPSFGRGVIASAGFVSAADLAAEAAAAAINMDAEADAQALDELLADSDLPLAEVEVLQAGADSLEPNEDDLTQIDGIGPVFASRLREHGILTFARLAGTDEAALAEIVQTPAWRRPDFAAWIVEAARRAAGESVANRSAAVP